MAVPCLPLPLTARGKTIGRTASGCRACLTVIPLTGNIMKNTIFLAAMLMIPMVHAAPQFKEGVNNDVVSQTGSAQPKCDGVLLLFLPHCAKFEPIAEELEESLPEGVPMKKNPVAFLWAVKWARDTGDAYVVPAC